MRILPARCWVLQWDMQSSTLLAINTILGNHHQVTTDVHLSLRNKTESTRKSSNFNFQWTKTLYQNNLKKKNLDYDFFFEIHLKSVFRFCVLLHNPQSVLQINPDFLIGTILYFARERASGRFWSTGVCFHTIAFWAIDYEVLGVSYPLFYLFCFCCFCFDCIERVTIMDAITIMFIFCLKCHLKIIRKS